MMCDFEQISDLFVCRRCGSVKRGNGRVRAACQAANLDRVRRRSPLPCTHLGPQTGLRDCGSCKGNVRQKTFDCLKGHGSVTLAECSLCTDYQAPEALAIVNRQRLLLRFTHGLGDHVQLTAVLQHLAALHPDWTVELACHAWKAQGFVEAGLCAAVHEIGSEPPISEFDAARTLYFYEPDTCYADSPSTKSEKCLREIFGITPRSEWCGYKLHVSEAARERVAEHLPRPYVLIHYSGHTARRLKDLDENAVKATVKEIMAQGLEAVIIDLDHRSKVDATLLRKDHPVWGFDVSTLAALAERSVLNIGIDSGPGKVFAAVATPAIICWRGLHPLHYHGLSGCLHLVPQNHSKLLRGNAAVGLEYFSANYRYREQRRNLCDELPALVKETLSKGVPCLFPPTPCNPSPTTRTTTAST